MKTNARARAGRERERAKKNAEGALSLSDDDDADGPADEAKRRAEKEDAEEKKRERERKADIAKRERVKKSTGGGVMASGASTRTVVVGGLKLGGEIEGVDKEAALELAREVGSRAVGSRGWLAPSAPRAW